MTGRVEQTLTGATSRSRFLSRHCSARSWGWKARRARVGGWDSRLARAAAVLEWAVVMLLVGAALLFAVANVVGYQWPGLVSPALPMPTPQPGLDL